MTNRMRELRSCGSVRAEGSNVLGYSDRCREAFPGNFRRGRGGSLGSLRRFEFDQVQGLSLPGPQ
jgi:hypothetical protein